MRRRRLTIGRVALAATLGLLPLATGAADYSIHSEVDATQIGVEDQVQLTISLEGEGPDSIAMPTLTNLTVAGGPYQSTQVSIVNGRMTQTRSWTYVLRPQAEGAAEIGPVTAGEETAAAIRIEIVAGSVRPPEPARRADPFGADPFESFFGRRRGRRADPKLLVEAVPSRTKVRVGEPLLLTYYLYTQVAVSNLNFTEAPQFAGFWAEDLEQARNPPSGEAATAGGETYRRFPVMRKLLFPTRAGTLEIPPATLRIALAAQGFFDEGQMVERSTRPVTVSVAPLPDVAGFSGAVGRFQARTSLDKEAVALGEAALLRFRVEGTGNLKWIDRPPSIEVAGAKLYPPQVKSDLKVTAGGIRGSRTWEFVLVPETGGSIEVPAVDFMFFDPEADEVMTARTDPLTLRVEGGTMAAGPSLPVAPSLGDGDALPLRADIDPGVLSVPALSGRAMALLAVLVLLGHAALWGGDLLRGAFRRVGGHTTPVRSVRAALRDIERAGKAGMTKEQAAALLDKGLHEAFGEITDDGSEKARAIHTLLSEVHFVRYAPQLGDYSETLGDLARRAAETVRRWA
ncbi:MAG: BatD family protein [Acidobacteria bacterium]|nr:BatD family protein [Acidobacteriota bacterium]